MLEPVLNLLDGDDMVVPPLEVAEFGARLWRQYPSRLFIRIISHSLLLEKKLLVHSEPVIDLLRFQIWKR